MRPGYIGKRQWDAVKMVWFKDFSVSSDLRMGVSLGVMTASFWRWAELAFVEFRENSTSVF